MRIGLAGLPQSGKTTVLKLFAGGHIGHSENMAMIKLPDPRLLKIAEIVNAAKTTFVEFELYEPQGNITKGGAVFSDLQGAYGLVIVIRGFDGGFGAPQILEDAQNLKDLMILYDAGAVETRMGSLEAEIKKGRTQQERDQMTRDLHTLEKFAKTLSDGGLIRNLELSDDEKKLARNQGLMTAKPWFVVINTEDEADIPQAQDVKQTLSAEVAVLPAKLLMELAELPADEATAFYEDMGLSPDIVGRTIRRMIESFGFIEFYTGNEKEARAWLIPKGTTALGCAEKIHSDIARGFIRAEVISFEDFVAAGGYAQARAKALLRAEGKDYIVRDGDYLAIKFNV